MQNHDFRNPQSLLVTTLHQSKDGSSAICILGNQNNIFPHFGLTKNDLLPLQKKRLLYVEITRTQELLSNHSAPTNVHFTHRDGFFVNLLTSSRDLCLILHQNRRSHLCQPRWLCAKKLSKIWMIFLVKQHMFSTTVREPQTPTITTPFRFMMDKEEIGFLSRSVSETLAPMMDNGIEVQCTLSQLPDTALIEFRINI